MPPVIAVIADAHLSDCEGTAQDAALSWACSRALQEGADILLCLGDLTTVGTATSAVRVSQILENSGLTGIHTPGNAELRSPSDAAVVRDAFSTPTPFVCRDTTFICIDSSRGTISADERCRVERALEECEKKCILATHWPPTALPEDDESWFQNVCRVFSPSMLIAGHKHEDSSSEFGGISLRVFRGLDPDKARYAEPALGLLVHDGNSWQRRDIPFPGSTPGLWSTADRKDFLNLLGISTMLDTIAGLKEAADASVPCVEIRASDATSHPFRSLQKHVDRWRASGGRILSVHLPNLCWDTNQLCITGVDAMIEAVRLAYDLGVDRMTAHVPRATEKEMFSCRELWTRMLDTHCQCFSPVMDSKIEVGIENLHMRRGEPRDSRGFGYTPDECFSWIHDMRQAMPRLRIGLHLDIGHARNNGPFSNVWPLGRWYAECGRESVGYHLHQIINGESHQPIDNPYGPYISLASFFWAWSTNQLAHAPMFLEIRTESGLSSWRALTTFIDTTRSVAESS